MEDKSLNHTNLTLDSCEKVNAHIYAHSDNTDLKIIHTNIRSLNKNFEELEMLLHKLKCNFDIIVLSETWQIKDEMLYQLPGYSVYYNNSSVNQNDGVVMYVKSNINHSTKVITLGELAVLRVSINVLHPVAVTGIYRSPSTNPDVFNINIANYVKKHCTSKTEILVGDTNINIMENQPKYVETYKQILLEYGFLPHINSVTRRANCKDTVTQTCIDHFYVRTNLPSQYLSSIVLEEAVTDHFPIILIIRKTNKQLTKWVAPKTKLMHKTLSRNLSNIKWVDILQSSDTQSNVEHKFGKLIDVLNHEIQKATITIQQNKKNTKRSPWITQGLINSINIKNKLYKQSLKNRNLHDTYLNYKAALNRLIKTAKRAYYTNLLSMVKQGDSKNFWKIANSILGRNKIVRNGDVNENLNLANKFNDHFANVGANIHKRINKVLFRPIKDKVIKESCVLSHITESEMLQYIHKLKNNKSPGIDNIPNEVLKINGKILAQPLGHLFNSMLDEGLFPNVLKRAVVVPLHKGGDKENLNNYRPITLISSISNLMEKILKCQITAFLTKHNVINAKQYGFQEKKSTVDAIAELLTGAVECIDKTQPIVALFCDVEKAFDSLDQKHLLDVLYDYGFRGKSYDILASYLCNRSQCVKVGNVVSKNIRIKTGTPQGSVLGPLLFTIYINSMFIQEFGRDVQIIAYADDTTLLIKGDSWETLSETAEASLKKYQDFLSTYKLQLNISKTKAIAFTASNKSISTLNIKIHKNSCVSNSCTCETVQQVDSIKYLGIIIDGQLKWKQHIEYVKTKISRLQYGFRVISKICDPHMLKILYFSLVQSVLSYGLIVWGGTYLSLRMPVETVQKKIIKIILKKPQLYPSNQIFDEFKVFDINCLYILEMCKHYFKNKSKVTLQSHTYNTRSKPRATANITRYNKTISHKNFLYNLVNIYNSIPNELKSIKNYHLYIRLVKKWIITTKPQVAAK